MTANECQISNTDVVLHCHSVIIVVGNDRNKTGVCIQANVYVFVHVLAYLKPPIYFQAVVYMFPCVKNPV